MKNEVEIPLRLLNILFDDSITIKIAQDFYENNIKINLGESLHKSILDGSLDIGSLKCALFEGEGKDGDDEMKNDIKKCVEEVTLQPVR